MLTLQGVAVASLGRRDSESESLGSRFRGSGLVLRDARLTAYASLELKYPGLLPLPGGGKPTDSQCWAPVYISTPAQQRLRPMSHEVLKGMATSKKS